MYPLHGYLQLELIPLNGYQLGFHLRTFELLSTNSGKLSRKNGKSMKSNYSYSPSCRATQTKSKIRGLHVKEAILLRLMFGCVEAAGEQQQVLCVHVPAGASAYIHSAEGFLKAPPTSVSSTVYAEMCCCATHTLFHLPSTFQH